MALTLNNPQMLILSKESKPRKSSTIVLFFSGRGLELFERTVYIFFYSLCIFIPALAGRLSQASERQQVSSCLQNFSGYSGGSQQCCSLNGLDSSFSILWRPFRVHQLQLISPSPTCSTVFLVLRQGPSNCLSFHFLLFSTHDPLVGLVWFVGFYGISTFVGYLTPNPFLCK